MRVCLDNRAIRRGLDSGCGGIVLVPSDKNANHDADDD